MEKLEYWKKQENLKDYAELKWNIPEQKSGSVALIGGNAQSFSGVVRAAEFLQKTYPVSRLNIVLPDALKSKLPPLSDLSFVPSTDSGSIAKSEALNSAVESSDFAVFLGDLSKNSATTIAVSEAIKNTEKPVLLTRDSVDLILPEMGSIIEQNNLFFVASMTQLQKLLRAVYYPKMLLLSMPLMQVVETLHKFTLSYSVTILTFHQDQIIVASGGKVVSLPLNTTDYTPISLWGGELACKIAAMNLYNPGKPLEATLSAI